MFITLTPRTSSSSSFPIWLVIAAVLICKSDHFPVGDNVGDCALQLAGAFHPDEVQQRCPFTSVPSANTDPGVSLLCRSEHSIHFRMPREPTLLSVFTGDGTLHQVVRATKPIEEVSQLNASSTYTFHLWRIVDDRHPHGPFVFNASTLDANSTPLNVTAVRLDDLVFTGLYADAMIEWQPAEDKRCAYEIVVYDSEDYDIYEINRPEELYKHTFHNLHLGRSYTVGVRAKSFDSQLESGQVLLNFAVPSCLDVYKNLSVCAPNTPDGLTISTVPISRTLQTFNATVRWTEPAMRPDFYAVELANLLGAPNERFTQNVSGQVSSVMFPDVMLPAPRWLFASVQAVSKGGISPLATTNLLPTKEPPTVTVSQFGYVRYVYLTIGLVAVLVVITISALCYTHVMRKKYNKEPSQTNQYSHEFKQKMRLSEENECCIIDQWELSPDQLTLKTVLGEGAFGVVYKALLHQPNCDDVEVAVKMLRDDPTADDMRAFYHEIEIMKNVGSHPNLVSILGCVSGQQPMLAFEFCQLGDLQSYLRSAWDRLCSQESSKDFPYFDLQEAKSAPPGLMVNHLYDLQGSEDSDDVELLPEELLGFAKQIAVGMEYLSKMRVLHRDLAARNVLVCADKTVKVADFGLSRDVYRDNVYRKKGAGKLPVRWMAIESITHQIYTTQSDVWSFGILLWEIVTLGGNPYPSIQTRELLKYLLRGYRMECPKNCSHELYDIMLSCWKAQPKERPTFTELKNRLNALLEDVYPEQYITLGLLPETRTEQQISQSVLT